LWPPAISLCAQTHAAEPSLILNALAKISAVLNARKSNGKETIGSTVARNSERRDANSQGSARIQIGSISSDLHIVQELHGKILSFPLVQFRGAGQYQEKLRFGWTKFRGAGHLNLDCLTQKLRFCSLIAWKVSGALFRQVLEDCLALWMSIIHHPPTFNESH